MHFVLAHYPQKKNILPICFALFDWRIFSKLPLYLYNLSREGEKDTSLLAFFMAHGSNALTFEWAKKADKSK